MAIRKLIDRKEQVAVLQLDECDITLSFSPLNGRVIIKVEANPGYWVNWDTVDTHGDITVLRRQHNE